MLIFFHNFCLCFWLIFRIKNDWEAWRIQVCRSGGAIQFQLWWQCPWDELSPIFPFPFLTVTECSEMKTLVLLPEVVVPELVLLSHSSIWLSNLNSTRRCGKATNAWENKPRTWTLSKLGGDSSEQRCLMESKNKRDTITAAPTHILRGLMNWNWDIMLNRCHCMGQRAFSRFYLWQ